MDSDLLSTNEFHTTPASSLDHGANELIGDQFRSVDPRNVQATMIVAIVVATIVSTGILVGLGFIWLRFGLDWQFYACLSGGLALIILLYVGSFIWPKLEHNRTQYRIDQEGFEIRHGVVWHHQITVPLGRVQHADVSQGPIQRMFGISTLTVHTAGTQNASIALEGLEHTIAMSIRDLIVHQRKGQDAV